MSRKTFIRRHVLAKKFWPSSYICCFGKSSLVKIFFQICSLSFLNARDNLSFLSAQGFFSNIYLSFTDIYQHLSNLKTTKVKLPYQIKSLGTNQTPSFSKLLNKITFNKIQTLPEITMYFNYWNYIEQRKTVSTTSCRQEMTFVDIIHSDATTLSIFIIQQII